MVLACDCRSGVCRSVFTSSFFVVVALSADMSISGTVSIWMLGGTACIIGLMQTDVHSNNLRVVVMINLFML